ncbi:hypothetical protein ANABIO4_15220 [Bacillus subtilis]|nr:hypothetical protein ANABIO4_15220 [Bacillus subtilis]
MKPKTGRFTSSKNRMELKIKDSIETSICHNLKPPVRYGQGVFMLCARSKAKDADRYMEIG